MKFAPGISLCMIVKDEERFLAGALASVAGVVNELCIVDTGSTDRTREIARAHGARVVDVAWNADFAAARNAALALATRGWIFVLDADERLMPESRAALSAVARTAPQGRGKWIICRNLTDDYHGSGAMSNVLVRLFPNSPRIRYRNRIHEFVALDGDDGGLPADRTPIEIVHHGYLRAVVLGRNKGDRNLQLSRAAVAHDPTDAFHQYNLGMASLLAGDRESALLALDLTRALTEHVPRGFRVHALVTLADLYAEHRADLPSALALVRESLGLVPNYSNAHFSHGKILVRMGDLHAARDAFGRAIAAGADDGQQFVVDNEIAIWKAHSEIGATLMHENRFAEALAWFDLAARSRPAAQPLVINRAKCHEALGDRRAAHALFRAAFDADCDTTSSVEWINFLLRCGNVDSALGAIAVAVPHVDDETAVVLLATQAALHLRAGKAGAAQIAVDRAVERGNRATASATVAALAVHYGVPALAELLPAPPPTRANERSIAYVTTR
jgi:tetratricopeptide (TPR) repeat protein